MVTRDESQTIAKLEPYALAAEDLWGIPAEITIMHVCMETEFLSKIPTRYEGMTLADLVKTCVQRKFNLFPQTVSSLIDSQSVEDYLSSFETYLGKGSDWVVKAKEVLGKVREVRNERTRQGEHILDE